jgi:hypothetical protein
MACEEVPLPLPGERATISCPHSYPLFYEPLGLGEGHRFLEVGVGSGYGTSLAREVVGRAVWSLRSRSTPQRSHLRGRTWSGRATATWSSFTPMADSGTPANAPYDRICVTVGLPRCPAAADRAAGPARLADRAYHRSHTPATDPAREDRGRRAPQEPGGRPLRVAAGTVWRPQRSAHLSLPTCASRRPLRVLPSIATRSAPITGVARGRNALWS